MRAPLSLLVLTLSHLALSLFLPNPSPNQHLPPRQLQPPSLPYPRDTTPSTCPAPAPPATNPFSLSGFHPYSGSGIHHHRPPNSSPPPTDLDFPPPNDLKRRTPTDTQTHICHQIAGFLFPPLGATMATTQEILLQPGKDYVFSIAADVAVQGIVAWAWVDGVRTPGGRVRRVGLAHPGQNAGTLALSAVTVAVRVFFVVSFGGGGAGGEVGLFALGAN